MSLATIKRINRLAAILYVLIGPYAPGVFGAERFDLARTTPVPADQPIPVGDFFRPPLFSSPKLNPAGTHFAAIVETGDDHTALLLCDLEKRQIRSIKGSGDKDVDSIDWLGDQYILSTLSREKLYAEGLFVTQVDNLNRSDAILYRSAARVVGVPGGTPLKPFVWIYRDAYDEGNDYGMVQLDATRPLGRNEDAMHGSIQEQARLNEVNEYGTRASIDSRQARPPGEGVVVNYLADMNGQLAFAIMAEQGAYTLYLFEYGTWRRSPVDLDDVILLAAGDRPNELIVAGPRQKDKPRAVQRLNAATGKLGEVLFQDGRYDVSLFSTYRHPETRVTLGIRTGRMKMQSFWFDENYKAVQKTIESHFAGKIVQILGSNREETRFFAGIYSDSQPVEYYSLNFATKALELIKSSAPWIDPSRMRPMNVMKFKTRDGYQLDAYVTLPVGASKENPPPLVVLPHGGPWTRDYWGFDEEVQFLASRGYAVLQPNYRGSTGCNWMFSQEQQWDFRLMHNDVTDAVDQLIESGLVDKNRLAIMGSSFGGYLALCGAAFEPARYKCAVTISGVFDWEQVIKDSKYDRMESAEYGILNRNLGDPGQNRARFDEISPLRHVQSIKVPVFVSHGKEDSVAKVGESRRLIAEMDRCKVPHESFLVGGEGHGMSRLKNQIELYSRIEVFLDKNLKHTIAN